MNRRHFLTSAGIAVGGAVLWGCATQDEPVRAPSAAGNRPPSLIPTTAGAKPSQGVALVSHDAADLAVHWSSTALPARTLRAAGPAAPLSTTEAIGATIVGVTGLTADHGALRAWWVHAARNLPFGLWHARMTGEALVDTAAVRQKLHAPTGQIRLQWELGADAKREVVFGTDVALARGLYAVPLAPTAGADSPVLWVCLDATSEPLRGPAGA